MCVAIIKKLNKKNGTTYVYESTSYWDKEKQQPRSKRKLIGKVDPETGETVPTGGRGRKPGTLANPDTLGRNSSSPQKEPCSPPTPNAHEEGDYRALYEDCLRRLQECEAALAKSEASVASMEKERQEVLSQLIKVVGRLQH